MSFSGCSTKDCGALQQRLTDVLRILFVNLCKLPCIQCGQLIGCDCSRELNFSVCLSNRPWTHCLHSRHKTSCLRDCSKKKKSKSLQFSSWAMVAVWFDLTWYAHNVWWCLRFSSLFRLSLLDLSHCHCYIAMPWLPWHLNFSWDFMNAQPCIQKEHVGLKWMQGKKNKTFQHTIKSAKDTECKQKRQFPLVFVLKMLCVLG